MISERKIGETMYCVVINKFLNRKYMVRHIIYDISPEEDMSSIKEKYYKDYYKTDTDIFYLCQNKQELDELLKKVMK